MDKGMPFKLKIADLDISSAWFASGSYQALNVFFFLTLTSSNFIRG